MKTIKNIKRKIIRNLIAIVLLTFVTGSLHAFAQTNFVGKWELEKQKTDFSKTPEWVLPARVSFELMQGSDGLLPLIRNFSVKEQEQPSYAQGFPSADTLQPTTTHLRVSFSWNSDKSTLTIGSRNVHEDGTPGNTISETWSLSADKTEMIIISNVSQPNGTKYTLKGFYAKAP